MTAAPTPWHPPLVVPRLPPGLRYAIACRASAVVLEREGQPAAAQALRTQAELVDQPNPPSPSTGDIP